jgi:hypothetical protein
MKQTAHSIKKNTIISFSSLASRLTLLPQQSSPIHPHHRPIPLPNPPTHLRTLPPLQLRYRLCRCCRPLPKKGYFQRAKNGSFLPEQQGSLRNLLLPIVLNQQGVSRKQRP